MELVKPGGGRIKQYTFPFYKQRLCVYVCILASENVHDSVWLPGDFTLVDLQAPLGHVAHALLTLLTAVHGQVVNIGSLIRHLKVPDTAVTLRQENEWLVNHSVCVCVKGGWWQLN